MKIEQHADAASFIARAESFLFANDPVNQMVYGIAARVRDGSRFGDGSPAFWTVVRGDEVQLAALRTPPYSVVVSGGSAPAAEELGRVLAEGDDEVPGVAGPREEAGAFAASFTRKRGLSAKERIAQELHTLTEVTPPRPGSGVMRSATEADRALLVDWFAAFDAEAVGDGADAAAAVDRHFRAGTIRLYDDDDHVVSMLVSMPVTPRAVRIGGVYTPPDLRGRGYASRLVADATREALAGGSEYVCLLTDVSNPTSNAIYRSLGYAPAGQFTIIDF